MLPCSQSYRLIAPLLLRGACRLVTQTSAGGNARGNFARIPIRAVAFSSARS